MDSQRPRDGEYIESLGHYDPRTKELSIDLVRAGYWTSVGAQPTGTAGKLIKRFARGQGTPSAGEVTAELSGVIAEATAVETALVQGVDHQVDPTASPPVTDELPGTAPDASKDDPTT